MRIDWKYVCVAVGSALILYGLFVVAFERESDFSGWAFLILFLGGGALFSSGVLGSLFHAFTYKNILQPGEDYTDSEKSLKAINAARRARVKAARREGKI